MLLMSLTYLTGSEQVVSGFAKEGYPQHLRIVLGVAKPAAAIACAKCLRRVVEHQKTVLGGNRGDRIVIGGQAKQIDRDNGARVEPQPLRGGNRPLAARSVSVVTGIRLRRSPRPCSPPRAMGGDGVEPPTSRV